MTEKMSQKSNITSLKLQEPLIVVYDRMKQTEDCRKPVLYDADTLTAAMAA